MIITTDKEIIYNINFQKCKLHPHFNYLEIKNLENSENIKKAYFLLNDNKKYALNILEIINKKISNQISWNEYLEEIINLFQINTKKSDIFTPVYIVDKMLSKYTKEFSNPMLKWFDPSNGEGVFIFKLIQKLLENLKIIKGLENENIRYKWIIEKMIYVCDSNSLSMFNYMLLIDPNCQFKLNTYYGSYITKSFDKVNENEWKLDSNTRILGNLQSKDTLSRSCVKFFGKSLTISNYVNFIVPHSIVWSISKTSTELRKKMQTTENFIDIRINDKDVYTKGKTIITTIKSDRLVTKILSKDGIIEVENKNIHKRLPIKNEIITSIINKIESKPIKLQYVFDFKNHTNKTTSKKLLKDGLVSETQDDIFKYPVHHSSCKILYAQEPLNTWGKLKVAFNYSGNFIGKNRKGGEHMFSTTNLIGKQMVGVLVNSQEEANIVINNYSSKIFEFYIKNEKSSGFNTGLHYLPKLPLIKFSDKNLYTYFDFTSEEIKLIENTMNYTLAKD
jgi:hypothetical protein